MSEHQARDALAAEYAADGHPHHARVRRWPLDALPYTDRVAIRALMKLERTVH